MQKKKKVVSKKKPAKPTKKQRLAVAIAKDVIKQIKLSALSITNGGYVTGRVSSDCDITSESQVKPHLPLIRQHCNVCAKGALFLSYIELKNEVTFGNSLWHQSPFFATTSISFCPDRIKEIMTEAFSEETFDRIEDAFERWGDRDESSRLFGEAYPNPADRMVAICENIIKNRGEFKP